MRLTALCPLLLCLGLNIGSACANGIAPAVAADRPAAAPRPPATEVVVRGLSLIDTPYRFGGTTRETGLDCSALVQKVYREAIGLQLPRTTRGLARSGDKVSRKDLQPGDLVFFNTRRRAFSHVGIYLGGNRFLHAPSRGGKVRVERLSVAYWAKRFNGARRVLPATDPVQLTSLSQTTR